MKKIVVFFCIMIIFSACKTLELGTYYTYGETSKEIENKIDVYATIMDTSKKEKSPLTSVAIISKDKNNDIKESFQKIKIISDKKEYLINVDFEHNAVYPVLEKGIIIDSDEFILEIGKVKFNDGTILNIPPLLFKRYIYIYKLNRVLDTLNQNTREDLFSGTIEEYREWKKKNN